MLDIEPLTVVRLRGELKKRGLPTDGLKAILIERLRASLQHEGVNPPSQAVPLTNPLNHAGTISEPVRTQDCAAVELSNPTVEREGAEEGNPRSEVNMSTDIHKVLESQHVSQDDKRPFHETSGLILELQADRELVSETQCTKRQRGRREQCEPSSKLHTVDDRLHLRPSSPSLGIENHAHVTGPPDAKTEEMVSTYEPLWMSNVTSTLKQWNESMITDVYNSELGGGKLNPCTQRIQLLEINSYLEKVLWPNFNAQKASAVHVLSIIVMVNEKFRENMSAWSTFHEPGPENFPSFFHRVITLDEHENLTLIEKTARAVLLINAFQSLEDEVVRKTILPLVSLTQWVNLSPGRLQLELSKNSCIEKHWRYLMKKETKSRKHVTELHSADFKPLTARVEVTWLSSLLRDFIETCANIKCSERDDSDVEHGSLLGIRFCERILELIIDLLSQLPTRRFVRTLLDDSQILVKAMIFPLHLHPAGQTYKRLVDLFRFYLNFEVDDHNGLQMTEEEVVTAQHHRLRQFQRLCFQYNKKLLALSLSHCGAIENRNELIRHISVLDTDELHHLITRQLKLISPEDPMSMDSNFLLEVLVSAFQKRRSQRQTVNELPLYPNEEVILNDDVVMSSAVTDVGCLALPKLNLQFLTFQDYLLRNFNLFRLEATHEIREDIADVLRRMGPYRDVDTDELKFSGWARMGLPIAPGALVVTEVQRPRIGEAKPTRAICEVKLDLENARQAVRSEWDQIKRHDVLFMIAVGQPSTQSFRGPGADDHMVDMNRGLAECYGVKYVRGAEVLEVRHVDLCANDLEKGSSTLGDTCKRARSYERTLVLSLDTAQYYLDNSSSIRGAEDIYDALNVVMRRKPKENNFKSVLGCIRDVMNDNWSFPNWLHDIILGYGDPRKTHPEVDAPRHCTIDFNDTFIDTEHICESFPGRKITFTGSCESSRHAFKVTFQKEGLVVKPYVPNGSGPYYENQPQTNNIRFTPRQVDAIRAGVQEGLTLIIGPPGTGKTDTAAQIMSCLYHNQPGQRTLVITHSNAALNDLFHKLAKKDVPARYLLRLGQGESDLETDIDFSRIGRVNAMLNRRLKLLAEIERLASCLCVPLDVAYTCETASNFWLFHVLSRWETFEVEASNNSDPSFVSTQFPFTAFFSDTPKSLFEGNSLETDMTKAKGYMRHIRNIFDELKECRAFELLKGVRDRSNYLLTKHAKIIAMTCTHAALKRRDFIQLGLKYDSLIIEESAQILEIESLIPMLLQDENNGSSRLKRVVMIGDHRQLPPVVKNVGFKTYCRLDQSMFARFVRLGVPSIQLDAQGRARPTLARLYSWCYDELGDLPSTSRGIYEIENPGFVHELQFVNVGDYHGRGEIEPTPHFYQNLGEAEYVVNVFQYMRLIGYPASKISIITTYRGQKHLIRDIIARRCAHHPLFGVPSRVTTVDKYQGQQNDYVLLSLVRTRSVGHMRDIRRMVVALSRARLGLYVFGCMPLFERCIELSKSIRNFLEYPTKLALVPTESYPSEMIRKQKATPYLVEDATAMGHVVNQLAVKFGFG